LDADDLDSSRYGLLLFIFDRSRRRRGPSRRPRQRRTKLSRGVRIGFANYHFMA